MTLYQATCVAIGERGLLIEGPPGSGKSSLALALLDRGAMLVGDDGVHLSAAPSGRLLAAPPPATSGLLEIRNVGIVRRPFLPQTVVSIVLQLDHDAPRFVERADSVMLAGCTLPLIRLWPDSPMIALRAEAALSLYGL